MTAVLQITRISVPESGAVPHSLITWVTTCRLSNMTAELADSGVSGVRFLNHLTHQMLASASTCSAALIKAAMAGWRPSFLQAAAAGGADAADGDAQLGADLGARQRGISSASSRLLSGGTWVAASRSEARRSAISSSCSAVAAVASAMLSASGSCPAACSRRAARGIPARWWPASQQARPGRCKALIILSEWVSRWNGLMLHR
jgi:hypothetical protein